MGCDTRGSCLSIDITRCCSHNRKQHDYPQEAAPPYRVHFGSRANTENLSIDGREQQQSSGHRTASRNSAAESETTADAAAALPRDPPPKHQAPAVDHHSGYAPDAPLNRSPDQAGLHSRTH